MIFANSSVTKILKIVVEGSLKNFKNLLLKRKTKRHSKRRYPKKSELKQEAKPIKKRPKRSQAQPTYYKSGKKVHYNNNYKSELKISSLNLDEGLKRQKMQASLTDHSRIETD